MHTFQNVYQENSDIFLNDEIHKIFFNTKGKKSNISQGAKNILKFTSNDTSGDDFTEKLAQEMQKIKENKEWQVEYMTLLMREREKYNEGRVKEKHDIAKNLIVFGMQFDNISQMTGLSVKEINQ